MEAWHQFLSQVEQELGPEVVSRWLRTLKISRFDAGNLYLEAANTFQVNWFEEHIRPSIKTALLNQNGRPIKVHLSSPSSSKQQIKKEEESRFSIQPDPTDPAMNLDQFLPCPKNLMAYKLISEWKSAPPFNPIFLHGPKGAGKTHLLMAVAQLLKQEGKRVFFTNASTFTEHVVQAIRLGMMREFRKIYRDIDALILDDIHTFSRRVATQEEFFHTFNTLHTLNRPLFLSSNVPPSSLEEIEPRLVSRFEWGLSIAMDRPDFQLILEKKAALWNLTLPPELMRFLLDYFPRDPLLALQALALRHTKQTPLTPEIAAPLLTDLLENEKKNELTAEMIVKIIAAHYGVRGEDLLGKSQMREVVVPRQVAMFLCREKLQWPFQKIGRLFARDHSTVMASVKQIQKGVEEKNSSVLEALSKI